MWLTHTHTLCEGGCQKSKRQFRALIRLPAEEKTVEEFKKMANSKDPLSAKRVGNADVGLQ